VTVRCVRCRWPEDQHGGEPVRREVTRVFEQFDQPCHRYEPPAPWWMRALNWRPR
jgi:hypothetical protein